MELYLQRKKLLIYILLYISSFHVIYGCPQPFFFKFIILYPHQIFHSRTACRGAFGELMVRLADRKKDAYKTSFPSIGIFLALLGDILSPNHLIHIITYFQECKTFLLIIYAISNYLTLVPCENIVMMKML